MVAEVAKAFGKGFCRNSWRVSLRKISEPAAPSNFNFGVEKSRAVVPTASGNGWDNRSTNREAVGTTVLQSGSGWDNRSTNREAVGTTVLQIGKRLGQPFYKSGNGWDNRSTIDGYKTSWLRLRVAILKTTL